MKRRGLGLGALPLVAALGMVPLTATGAAAATECEVDYAIQNDWGSGFTAQVTIDNLGDPLDGWTLEFALPGDAQVTNGWNASWSQSGRDVTAESMGWNGSLDTGDSVSVGFNGSYSGTLQAPASFTVNGVACGGTGGDPGTPEIITTPSDVTVPESGTASFDVSLSAQPEGDVSVDVSRASGDGDLSVDSGSTLTFGSGNWDQPQQVTLAAAEDGDSTDGAATFTASASGHTSATVSAREGDNDEPTGGEPGSYSWNNVEIVGGGFVTGIEFNASEPDLAYARTDIGGAYRWNESTQRWVPLTDWIGWDDYNLTGIEAIATDPVDPDRVYLAAGTYTQSWASNGAILRSTDRGETWQRTDLPFKLGANESGRSKGDRLVVDPNSNNVLYLASRNEGLWKSTDYGQNWSRLSSFPATGQSGIGLTSISLDPDSASSGNPTQTVYVGVADTATSLYRSTDGGATWEAVPGQPTGLLPHHTELASDGTLYVTYGDQPGPYEMGDGAVHAYDAGSGTWSEITPVQPGTGQGTFGYAGLAVDASDPDTVMVSTMGRWAPIDDVFRSDDGGQSWTSIGEQQNLDTSDAPYLDWGGTPKLGWMIGDIAIDPFDSGRAMYVTGATIYGTENVTDADTGGATNWSVFAEGLEETSVQDLISPPTGAPLLSALGDIGGFRHDDLTSSPAAGMSDNPIYSNTDSIDYAGQQPSVIVRAGTGSDIAHASYSTDGGTNWTPVPSEPENPEGGGKIAVSADGSTFVWTPNQRQPHYSTDRGASWTASSGLPNQATVVADKVNPGLFYSYDSNAGNFYVSEDGGASFSQAASGLPSGESQWAAVPDREGHVWLATGTGGLWRSTDAGQTFTQVSGVTEAFTIGFGRAAPGESYMAAYIAGLVDGQRGVFRSDDAGSSWVRINDDQHQYGWIGQTITGDPDVYGRVYLGTNGRGIILGEPSG